MFMVTVGQKGRCLLLVLGSMFPRYKIKNMTTTYELTECGFLGQHCIKHWHMYDGKLAQVVDICSENDDSPTKQKKYRCNISCCSAVIIDTEQDEVK